MKTFFKRNVIWATFFASAIVMLIIASTASKMMIESAEIIEEASRQNLLSLSRAAALLVTADELDQFTTAEDMELEEYQALNRLLIEFNTASGTEYTYFLRLVESENMMQFIIDNSEGTDALSVPLVPREESPDLALLGTPVTVPLGSYSEGWEGYMTAYAPVRYADGRLSNIVAGVDMLDVYIKHAQQNMHTLSIFLICSIIVVLGTCLYSLRLYHRKAKQALIASEAKSSFLSRMSHEIRTPLNAIMGFCSMAIASSEMPEIKEYLTHIDSSSQHLKQIVDDVLDISKIESGKVVLESFPADIFAEIDRISEIIRPQAENKQQTFIIDVGENVPRFVRYDIIHVRQVVVNLLSNAVKFTPEEGTVKLRVSVRTIDEKRCNLLWAVEDTGIGISKEKQQTLFQPFEQADVSTTRIYGGTGLGLSISRNLVEMMGSRIQVESNVDIGSKFFFDLAMEVIDERVFLEANHAEDSADSLSLAGKRILVVEDVETNQIIIQDILEGYGAQVKTVSDGLEGYNEYISNPYVYSAILMDVQMPVLDGYEATEMIRSSDCENAAIIPIIAMTANVYKEDIEKAEKCGMNAHIGKPFDLKQIEEVLAATIIE